MRRRLHERCLLMGVAQSDDFWLIHKALVELYQTSLQNITMCIRINYRGGETDAGSTCKDFLQVQHEG